MQNNSVPTRSCPDSCHLTVLPDYHITQQADGISCGAICAWYATSRVTRIPSELFTLAHIPRLCTHMAHCLLYHHCPLPTLVSNSTVVRDDLESLQQSYQQHISECEQYMKTYEATIASARKVAEGNFGHSATGKSAKTAITLMDESVCLQSSSIPAVTDLNSHPDPPSRTTAVTSLPVTLYLDSFLIGVIYTHPSQRVHGLQHLRDGLRCESIEVDGPYNVYTIDLGHEPCLAIEGRHIHHDFTDDGVLPKMDTTWPGLVFQHIILDYFYMPNSWHALHFSEQMYTIILPILASKGAIAIGGEVWLPHIPCIQERLDRLWALLAP